MQEVLFIVAGPAYGTENAYNAMRSAVALVARPEVHVRVFLIGDGVTCARRGQKPASGYYNLADMLASLIVKGAEVACCGVCMDARAIADADLVDGARRSTMSGLAQWIVAADKVINF